MAKMPNETTQARRRLRPGAPTVYQFVYSDRRERRDGVKRGSIPEVSFDFCYTRARDSEAKSARAVCWLIASDSQTGCIHVVPLGSVKQFRLIAQELMKFSQLLGYSAITCWSGNEPATGQILTILINARIDYKIERFKAWRSFENTYS